MLLYTYHFTSAPFLIPLFTPPSPSLILLSLSLSYICPSHSPSFLLFLFLLLPSSSLFLTQSPSLLLCSSFYSTSSQYLSIPFFLLPYPIGTHSHLHDTSFPPTPLSSIPSQTSHLIPSIHICAPSYRFFYYICPALSNSKH